MSIDSVKDQPQPAEEAEGKEEQLHELKASIESLKNKEGSTDNPFHIPGNTGRKSKPSLASRSSKERKTRESVSFQKDIVNDDTSKSPEQNIVEESVPVEEPPAESAKAEPEPSEAKVERKSVIDGIAEEGKNLGAELVAGGDETKKAEMEETEVEQRRSKIESEAPKLSVTSEEIAKRISELGIGKEDLEQLQLDLEAGASSRMTVEKSEGKSEGDEIKPRRSGTMEKSKSRRESKSSLKRMSGTRSDVDRKTESSHGRETSNTTLTNLDYKSLNSRDRLQMEILKLHAMKPRTSQVTLLSMLARRERSIKPKETTYQLHPYKWFSSDKTFLIVQIVTDSIKSKMPVYKAELAEGIAQTIAIKIRNEIFLQRFDRYKICVMITIGQKKYHGFHCESRCLWNAKYDSLAHYTIETPTYFIMSICWGAYKE